MSGRKGESWSDEEIEYLRKHMYHCGIKEIALELKRTYEATKGRANILKRNYANNKKDNAYMNKFWRELEMKTR